MWSTRRILAVTRRPRGSQVAWTGVPGARVGAVIEAGGFNRARLATTT